uniref:Uncharacterized protein n=1 Tax=Anguilla anguilla TaxID=7936 RepID=A0A0E9TXY1_ANGAN
MIALSVHFALREETAVHFWEIRLANL